MLLNEFLRVHACPYSCKSVFQRNRDIRSYGKPTSSSLPFIYDSCPVASDDEVSCSRVDYRDNQSKIGKEFSFLVN